MLNYDARKNDALINQKVKSLIDFEDQHSASIKSIAIEKTAKINLTTRFLNGKMLMFSKVSVKSFAYDMIDVFMFPNAELQKIYDKYKINCCYLNQNLTDTDSTSLFFVFICDLQCNVKEDESRNTIFEVMLKSKYLTDLIYLQNFLSNLIVATKILKDKLVFLKLKVSTNLTL